MRKVVKLSDDVNPSKGSPQLPEKAIISYTQFENKEIKHISIHLLSEQVLSKDWLKTSEDKAWLSL
jgi:hypothetical protein